MLFIGVFISNHAFAQAPSRRFESPEDWVRRTEREEKARTAQQEADQEARRRQLRDLENQSQRTSASKNPLYVPANVVAKEDRERYAKLLEEPNSGIFRLYSNPGCKDEKCKPSAAARSDYSFINQYHVSRPYHEIGQFRNTLFSDGLYTQGIFASLGDVPIENVDLNHPGFKFLLEFKAALDMETYRAVRAEYFNGVEANGYRYLNSGPAQVNTTYVARIVQYKLAFPISSKSDKVNLLKELLSSPAYNLRADNILVFRVIRVDNDSRYTTIVWKQLRKYESPELVLTNDDLQPKK
jgi:hypothetical protein